MTLPIRVGIVDDHPGVRAGIRNMLAGIEDIIVVGEGTNGPEAIQLAQREKPDILLLDVELPILRGDEVAKQLRGSLPDVKILAISSYNDPIYVQGMLENGAVGYITKEEAPQLLSTAVHDIIQYRVKWISPNASKKVTKITLENTIFTLVELDILREIVLEKPDTEVMHVLNLDEKSFNNDLDVLMKKLEVNTRQELYERARCLLSTITEDC